jgi:hypothetical protein
MLDLVDNSFTNLLKDWFKRIAPSALRLSGASITYSLLSFLFERNPVG